jgi:hypothetical protein
LKRFSDYINKQSILNIYGEMVYNLLDRKEYLSFLKLFYNHLSNGVRMHPKPSSKIECFPERGREKEERDRKRDEKGIEREMRKG